jgi:hypothetical protein
MPEKYDINGIKLEDSFLQFGRIVVVTDSRPVPYILEYAYKCRRCGYKEYHENTRERIKCSECGIHLRHDDDISKKLTVFASQVILDGHTRDAISLVPLPQGQIDAAIIPKSEEGDYMFFILAINQPDPVDINIKWDKKKDRLLQMIDYIDDVHMKRLKKKISGMVHYKMAILISRFIGMCGDPSSNVLIVGDPGTGKTSTARFYSFSTASVVKLQDVSRLSLPGLLGSASNIVFNGQRIPLLQPGLIERCDMVVLDEFYDKSNKDLNKLKSSLSESTISSELHENRRSVKKRATVIATSNIPYYHLRRVQERQRNLSGVGFESMSLRNTPPNIKEEFLKENLNWRDGEDYALLDRFPIIFYVEQKYKSTDTITMESLVGEDKKYSDDELHRMIHIPMIEQYMKECSKIEFKRTDKFVEGIKRLMDKYYIKRGNLDYDIGDDIHSFERLQENFDRFLRYHAMINGRDEVIDNDIEWVDRFYSKTCDFVYTDELVWDPEKKVEVKKEVVEENKHLVDIKDSILKHLEDMEKKQDKRDGIVSACSLLGYKPEDVAKVLTDMISRNHVIQIPPNYFKLP